MIIDMRRDCANPAARSRSDGPRVCSPTTGHGSGAHRFRRDPRVTDLPPFDDADLFDEAGYLRLYPGIAEAMMQGVVDTAWSHYANHGRQEGRLPNDVDPAFYLATYPAIEHDLGRSPTAGDAAPHYITLGRARGYLPNAGAPRAENGAALHSPFGGFWTDQANALDLIQGRLDLGWIRQREAAMLRTFALEGVVEFDRTVDRDQATDAALAVAQAFTGMFPEVLFAPSHAAPEPQPWVPELTEQPVAALDLHMVSRTIRQLLLDKVLTDFLAVIFGSPPRLFESRAFLREAAPPDRDAAWHACSLPLQFVAVTFAVEDSQDGAALVWPGSHRLPDLLWAEEHISLAEAHRANATDLPHAITQREARVRGLLHGQEPRRLDAIAGRRAIRHANLIHAATVPPPPLQRRTLTAWYCPSYVVPCYQESTPARTHFEDGLAFSSGVYPALDPRD